MGKQSAPFPTKGAILKEQSAPFPTKEARGKSAPFPTKEIEVKISERRRYRTVGFEGMGVRRYNFPSDGLGK